MKVHFYSYGKTMENEPITFDEAMYLLQNHQPSVEEPDNYIGFTAPENQDTVIQFIRISEDHWRIDVPYVKDDRFVGSYVSETTHNNVIALVTNFFVKDTQIRQSLRRKDFENFQIECKKRWGIVFHFVKAT